MKTAYVTHLQGRGDIRRRVRTISDCAHEIASRLLSTRCLLLDQKIHSRTAYRAPGETHRSASLAAVIVDEACRGGPRKSTPHCVLNASFASFSSLPFFIASPSWVKNAKASKPGTIMTNCFDGQLSILTKRCGTPPFATTVSPIFASKRSPSTSKR